MIHNREGHPYSLSLSVAHVRPRVGQMGAWFQFTGVTLSMNIVPDRNGQSSN